MCQNGAPQTPYPVLGFKTLEQTELQYHDVSTYLRAWYKGKKNDSPIELGSDLGLGWRLARLRCSICNRVVAGEAQTRT